MIAPARLPFYVTPAKAGVYLDHQYTLNQNRWIPAYAGMTVYILYLL
jgi:hypothetical protein